MERLTQLKHSLFYPMLYSIQKFLATRASKSAAKWFASTLRILQKELGLYSVSTPSNPNEGFSIFKDTFPSLIREFLKQSPPTWPGQPEVLERLELGSRLDFTFKIIPEKSYREKIVQLCTVYYCNAFYTTCEHAEAAGLSKGTDGIVALLEAVDEVFAKEGTNDFFKLFEAEFR